MTCQGINRTSNGESLRSHHASRDLYFIQQQPLSGSHQPAAPLGRFFSLDATALHIRTLLFLQAPEKSIHRAQCPQPTSIKAYVTCSSSIPQLRQFPHDAPSMNVPTRRLARAAASATTTPLQWRLASSSRQAVKTPPAQIPSPRVTKSYKPFVSLTFQSVI